MNEERKMFTGNWTCSGCNGAITELPFEPDPSRANALLCRDCHKKRQGSSDRPRGDRPMFKGNWTCSGCGGSITELPFEPRDDSNLKCRDCFRK